MTDVVAAETAVNHVAIFVHWGHVLLYVVCVGPKGGHIGF